MTYIEVESDHKMTAFLAGLTPGKVLKDRSAMFTKVERQREKFLREKTKTELEQIRQYEVYLAIQMAKEEQILIREEG